jgi:hypothetical protein
MIHDLYDVDFKKVLKMEEIVFIILVVIAVITIFLGPENLIPGLFREHRETFQIGYLMMANLLVGVKVACGFFIIFYRYVGVERKNRLE